jgi:hypothetical protein
MGKEGAMTDHVDANPLPEASDAGLRLKAGMPVKYGGTVGIIKEIYRSETSENIIIRFIFPKNIFKYQSLGDIVLLEPSDLRRVEAATVEELREHIRLQKGLYRKNLDEAFGEALHGSIQTQTDGC